jgi:hypothetical protein
VLELPGLTNTGDNTRDIDAIRRYLARLIPQLEMELMSAQQDKFLDAYNALSQELGTVNGSTTAGALAQHILDKRNPHGVTLAQLGYNPDNLAAVELTPHGVTIRIGGKRGLQVNVQSVSLEISEWIHVKQQAQTGEDTAEGRDPVCYADAALGSWEREIPLPYWVGATLSAATDRDCWAGNLSGWGKNDMGTLRIYRLEDIDVPGDLRTIPVHIIGLGVYGYGE